MKIIIVSALVVAVCIAGVNAAGECGKASPEREAYKLTPCAMAAEDENAPVSDMCCARIKQLGKNPSCLCAVMLSNTAKSVGAKPEVSVTLPKRCNLVNRPVGYKCGDYTLP
ncbi:putative lipid-transfer protein DIR1 [Bienertia sinuspersici]